MCMRIVLTGLTIVHIYLFPKWIILNITDRVRKQGDQLITVKECQSKVKSELRAVKYKVRIQYNLESTFNFL